MAITASNIYNVCTGRMYVAEMNTYMKDANATGEFEPTSRIKLLEDTNEDGKMDKSSVFVDSLVLPRTILAVGDQLMVTVTNVQHIWAYRDTNGDGRPDVRSILVRDLNQPFGVAFAGQWLYVANTDAVVRFAFTPGDTVIAAPPHRVADLPAGGYNNHWTRNLLVSPDGRSLYITVGSATNGSSSSPTSER